VSNSYKKNIAGSVQHRLGETPLVHSAKLGRLPFKLRIYPTQCPH
jgi:hypothetical protein